MASALFFRPGEVDEGASKQRVRVARECLAEFLGTMFLAFVGSSAVAVTGIMAFEAMTCMRLVLIALVDGFLFYSLVYLTMRLTEGRSAYLNPAITLGLFIIDLFIERRPRHVLQTLLTLIAQFTGAICGLACSLLCVPTALKGEERLGISHPYYNTPPYQAFIVEAVAGFFLVMTVFAVRRNENRRSSLVIALCYMALRVMTWPMSGGYVNPARSLAPVVINAGKGASLLWVYLTASVAGAVLATPAFIILNHDALRIPEALKGTLAS